MSKMSRLHKGESSVVIQLNNAISEQGIQKKNNNKSTKKQSLATCILSTRSH